MAKRFKEWLVLREMATRTVINWSDDDIPQDSRNRDNIGIPRMTRPGFRKGDRKLIRTHYEEVEQKLNAATEQFGIHWMVGYIEPERDSKENDPEDWEKYRASSTDKMKGELDKWSREETERGVILPPPNPENTIVYIKQTSRVHPLTMHEQIHNIGHAIWLRNPEQMERAKQEIRKAVQVLQQAAHDADPTNPPPTEAECTVMLARLLDLLSIQRTLTMGDEDFTSPHKIALTGFNAWDECIFELLPAFVYGKGRLKLEPRGIGKVAQFDRTAAIPPNQAVIKHKQVRPFVWEKMASDTAAWRKVADIMTSIIIECLKASTWARKGGPIYPYDKITTT